MSKRMLQMLVVVVVVVAALGFVKFRQIQGAIAAGKSFQPPPEAVTTVVAAQADWQSTLEAVGSVEPVQGVTMSADLAGVVERISFQSGAHVDSGQVLVRLDTKQERAQLASAEAERELAQLRLERARPLLEQKVIPQDEFDQVSAQYKQAVARVAEIQALIDRKTIRAPFAGTTGIRQVNVGQYLNSGDPVVPVQSLDPVFVDFTVPQQQIALLRVGAAVEAAADSGDRATLSGRITTINPVVDDATRNVQVQATLRNPERRLRSGMYVTVRISLGASAPVIALPTSAINYAPYGNSVFIVEELKGPDGKPYRGVRQQFVKLGASLGDQVTVHEGVTAGQEIVTSGVFKLRTGMAVGVNNTVQPGNSPAPKPADS